MQIKFNESMRLDLPAGRVRFISTTAQVCNNPKFDANLTEKKRYKLIIELGGLEPHKDFIESLENAFQAMCLEEGISSSDKTKFIAAPKFWKTHDGVIQLIGYTDFPIAGGRDLKGYTGSDTSKASKDVITSGFLRFMKTAEGLIGMTFTISHTSVNNQSGFFGSYVKEESNVGKQHAERIKSVTPRAVVAKSASINADKFAKFDAAMEEDFFEESVIHYDSEKIPF